MARDTFNKGDTFNAYYADGYFEFTIDAVGTLDDGTDVYRGVAADYDYGFPTMVVTGDYIRGQRQTDKAHGAGN